MKNMYLAAAMVVSLAFSACSDEESGKADRAISLEDFFNFRSDSLWDNGYELYNPS